MTPAQQEKLMQALDKYLVDARAEATRIIQEQYMTGRNTVLDSVFGTRGIMTDPDKVWANSLIKANEDLITGVGRNYIGDVDNLTRAALTEGLSPKDIMQAFNSIGTKFESSSQVVAFDQVAKAQELGRTNEYAKLGIQKVEIMVAPDACDTCQPHNHDIEPLQGGDRPQYHIQCLCFDVPAADDAEKAREEEIDRSCFMDKDEFNKSREVVTNPGDQYGSSFNGQPSQAEAISGDVKDRIVNDLTDRMALTPGEMQRLADTLGVDTRYEAVNDFIHQWAITAGDGNELSLAIQEAATREFGLGKFSYDVSNVSREIVDMYNKEIGDILEKFCRVQYEATQEMFKAKGIEYVDLFRGVDNRYVQGLTDDVRHSIAISYEKGAVRGATMNPLSSYAPNYTTARQFAGNNGVIQYSRVHASEIMSTCRTGNGCLSEWEYVVMGRSRAVWETAAKFGQSAAEKALLMMGE